MKKAKLEAEKAQKEAERNAAKDRENAEAQAAEEKKKKKAALLEKKKQEEEEARKIQRAAVTSAAESFFGSVTRLKPVSRPTTATVSAAAAASLSGAASAAASAMQAQHKAVQLLQQQKPQPIVKKPITVNDMLALMDKQPELKKSHRIYNAAQNALSTKQPQAQQNSQQQ